MWNLIDKGGPVMIALAACSFVSLTIIIERVIFWVRVGRRRKPHLVNRLLDLAAKGRFGEIEKLKEASSDYVARVLYCGILHRHYSLRDALIMAGDQELNAMRRYMSVLDTIITLAPLLGILGTVLGIIESFDFLGEARIQDPRAVTGGIAQALLTTAAGLTIAIFTLIPYNYFRSNLSRASEEMERCGTNLEIVTNRLNNDKAGEGRAQ